MGNSDQWPSRTHFRTALSRKCSAQERTSGCLPTGAGCSTEAPCPSRAHAAGVSPSGWWPCRLSRREGTAALRAAQGRTCCQLLAQPHVCLAGIQLTPAAACLGQAGQGGVAHAGQAFESGTERRTRTCGAGGQAEQGGRTWPRSCGRRCGRRTAPPPPWHLRPPQHRASQAGLAPTLPGAWALPVVLLT